MRVTKLATLLICVVIALAAAQTVPVFPVLTVGIVTTPLMDCPGPTPNDFEDVHSCIRGTYVQWLHAAGIRVVPIRWDDSNDNKRAALARVNGVLFTGGSMDSHRDSYEAFWQTMCEIVNMVKKSNAMGDPLPLFGICQGFQMVAACGAHNLSVVEDGYVGMYPLMMPLNFTAAAAASRFLGSAPSAIANDLERSPTTLNYHHEGVSPAAFATGALASEYTVTSVNVDANGRSFVSTFEAKTASVFAVQWHPEWPPFDFSLEAIGKSTAAMEVSHWVAMFVREQLSLNNHSFESAEALEKVVVDQSPITYQGYGVIRYWIGGHAKEQTDAISTLAAALCVVAAVVAHLIGVVVGRTLQKRSTRLQAIPTSDFVAN